MDSEKFDQLLEQVLDGRAILFAGAGFSLGAVNLRGNPFKTGGQLADHFSQQLGLPDGTPLDDAAEEFANRKGAPGLIKELELEFTAKSITPAHLKLAQFPWKRIYTTNYDNVFETAFHQAGKRLKAVTLRDNIREIPSDSPVCVHFNGYVGDLNISTVWSDVKLTDTSYLTSSVASSPWAVLFRQDMEMARAVFFVGYSMADLDIKRIVFESRSLKDKTFFALGAAPAALTLRRAERFGTVLNLDTGTFAAALAKKATGYNPSGETEPLSYCLRKFSVSPPVGDIPDRFIFELLLYGRAMPDAIWGSLHGGQRYSMHRQVAQTALGRIKSGCRAIVIHSNLGNGKSLLLEQLKCITADEGFQVYSFFQSGDSLSEEIDWALKSHERTIFFVDNYPEWLDSLKLVASHLGEKTTLVLSARTSAHDVLVDRLSEILRIKDLTEIPIDVLADEELKWLVGFFDEYGLWGERAAWSPTKKLNYLKLECSGQWHAVLIRLFESPQISARLKAIFEDVKNQRNYYEILVTILILAVMGYQPSLSVLVDLCGSRILETGFRRDKAMQEIIDFGRGEVRLRSAVLGEHILKQLADPNTTVHVLISLARVADKSAVVAPYFFELFKNLTRFTNLQRFLPQSERRRGIIRYYETIKGLRNCATNPLFWLQYAIACLVFEEYDRAEKYFEAAYSYAKRRGTYDSYQIDNHYARFLLMQAVALGDADKSMTAFRKARKIIFAQIRGERLHYPFRVAAFLREFYESFALKLKKEQKAEIVRAAEFIAGRIEKLPEGRQGQRYVVECWTAMQAIIESS